MRFVSSQLSFDLGDRPSRRVMLYLALLPSAPAGRKIEALGRSLAAQHRMRGSTLPPSRLHLSMMAVVNDNHEHLRRLDHHVGSVAAQTNPVRISLDRVVSFKTAGVVALCGDDDAMEASALWAMLAGARSGFTPHVTVRYGTHPIPPIRLQTPIAWIADEIVLVASYFGEGRHEHWRRWRFGQARHIRDAS